LNGGVAVIRDSLNLRHYARTRFNERAGNVFPIRSEEACHTDFLTDDARHSNVD